MRDSYSMVSILLVPYSASFSFSSTSSALDPLSVYSSDLQVYAFTGNSGFDNFEGVCFVTVILLIHLNHSILSIALSK